MFQLGQLLDFILELGPIFGFARLDSPYLPCPQVNSLVNGSRPPFTNLSVGMVGPNVSSVVPPSIDNRQQVGFIRMDCCKTSIGIVSKLPQALLVSEVRDLCKLRLG